MGKQTIIRPPNMDAKADLRNIFHFHPSEAIFWKNTLMKGIDIEKSENRHGMIKTVLGDNSYHTTVMYNVLHSKYFFPMESIAHHCTRLHFINWKPSSEKYIYTHHRVYNAYFASSL